MGMFVIAAYRPHKGKEKALMQAVQEHIPILRKEGLVTDHEPYVMRAKDGTIVEVFAWQSEHAIEAAHSNPAVQQLWARFSACCDYDEIGNVAESKQLFSPFVALDV